MIILCFDYLPNLLELEKKAKFSQWGMNRPKANPLGDRLIPAGFGSQGRMGPLLRQELQIWSLIYAKRHAQGTAFSVASVQTAVLQRWRQRLSSSLQRGNAAIVRACLGCWHPRRDPEVLAGSPAWPLEYSRARCE